MMNVQNYRVTSAVPNFKANESAENKQQKSAQNVYKTNAATKTWAVYGGISAGLAFLAGTIMKTGASIAKNLDKDLVAEIKPDVEMMRKASKGTFLYAPIAFLASLACGMIVNKCINDKHAEFADKLEKQGKDEVLKTDEHAEKTRKGNVFYSSTTGKKVGTALGVVAAPVLTAVSLTMNKAGKVKPLGMVISAIQGALGGLLLGHISDNMSNKGARKFADK